MANRKAISTMSAAPVPITLNGTEYMFKPLDGDDLGELESWLKHRPLEELREQFNAFPELFPPEDRQALVIQAMKDSKDFALNKQEGAAALHTMEGVRYMLWLGLREALQKTDPHITRESIFKLVQLKDIGHVKAMLDDVSGLTGDDEDEDEPSPGEALGVADTQA